MNNWRDIWNRRDSSNIERLDLDSLIKLDGFDSGAGRIDSDDWRIYVQRIASMLKLKDGESVYEVGCGCGPFLYALCEQHSIVIGGNDYSVGLIDTVRTAFPCFDFQCIEASKIDSELNYDYVISNSVFQYFSLDYAFDVLNKMIIKAKKACVVLDVPDARSKEESEALRRDILTPGEYEKKYVGLSHTYYERKWFENIAAESGLTCEIFDGCVPNYRQNQFRFGCIIWKNM